MPVSLTPFFTVGLLILSNLFMTFAWYGHLKHREMALPLVILTSWGLAFFEYCFQVPANRYGYGYFSLVQLKVMQEIITLLVFMVFSICYFGDSIKWNHYAGFALLCLAVYVIFKDWP